MSRTSKTEENYKLIAKRLMARYNRDVPGPPYKVKFLDWLGSKKAQWRPSTWRQYKSAMMLFFEINGSRDLCEKLSKMHSDACAPPPSRGGQMNTSARKRKEITGDEFERLLKVLGGRRCTWATNTRLFLQAGLLTGLRPGEWEFAVIIDDVELPNGSKVGPVLKVKNAKNTNGRCHGEYRHLILSNLERTEINTIQMHISLVTRWIRDGGKYEKYYSRCRRCLYEAGREFPPRLRNKNITQYTMRHQFAANLKNAGYSLQKIGALMGHAVDDTATEHYGRKRSGRSSRLPMAHPDEIARVRVVYGSPKPKSPRLK